MQCFYEWRGDCLDNRGRFEFGLFHDHSFDAHWHAAIELLYVVEGEMLVCVDEEKQVARENDIVLSASGQIHYATPLMPGTKIILVIFDPRFVRQILNGQQFHMNFLTVEAAERLKIPQETLCELYSCLKMMAYEEQLKADNYLKFCECYLMIIVGLLMRHMPTRRGGTESPPISSTVMTMRRAMDYIQNHYDQDITLEQLAKHLYVSPFYLSRLFNKFTGKAFREYLNYVRINQVKLMMADTDQSLLDIALRCGFNNIRTFNRVFRKNLNTTPTAFQKSLLG